MLANILVYSFPTLKLSGFLKYHWPIHESGQKSVKKHLGEIGNIILHLDLLLVVRFSYLDLHN